MSYEAVEREIEAGRLWRAKEILQGRLSSPHFDQELLRRLGEVHLTMGDLIEAGRILYCSGARKPRYQTAIELFLCRNPRDTPTAFLARMPLMVRRQRHLADFVASMEFEKFGWTESVLRSFKPNTAKHRYNMRKPSRLTPSGRAVISISVLVFCVVCLLVGFWTIVQTIWLGWR